MQHRVRGNAITVAGQTWCSIPDRPMGIAMGAPLPCLFPLPQPIVTIPPIMPSCVAVDEVPEEGLDVPLRLEKMANQVTYQRLRAALTVGGCAHSLLLLSKGWLQGQQGMARSLHSGLVAAGTAS